MGANISPNTCAPTSDIGYVVLDVDPTDGEAIRKKLAEIPETIRVPRSLVTAPGPAYARATIPPSEQTPPAFPWHR